MAISVTFCGVYSGDGYNGKWYGVWSARLRRRDADEKTMTDKIEIEWRTKRETESSQGRWAEKKGKKKGDIETSQERHRLPDRQIETEGLKRDERSERGNVFFFQYHWKPRKAEQTNNNVGRNGKDSAEA